MENIIAQSLEKLNREWDKADEKFSKDITALAEYEENLFAAALRVTAEHMAANLTALDQLIRKDGNRSRRFTVQRTDRRTLLTTVGEVTFEHTLYREKETGKYRYLLDEQLKLMPHERLSEAAEVKILEEAARSSYERASKVLGSGCEVSKDTVKEKVHGIIEELPLEEKGEKKEAEYLYIEADEDHIHSQEEKKPCIIGKLLYLYEGEEKKGKRTELVNTFYLGGLYKGSEANHELWKRMNEYISKTYNTERLKKVYIGGDCGSWIKAGIGEIEKGELVMDLFHMKKYIVRISEQLGEEGKEVRQHIWKNLKEGRKKKFIEEMEEIRKKAGKPEIVEEGRDYLLNNWKAAVLRMQEEKLYGCSAEGHVSHMYSSRMSSRPMGWSECGADRMCRLRCYIKDYGKEGLKKLVHYGREEKRKETEATGTDGVRVEKKYVRAWQKEHYDQNRSYIDRIQATIPGSSVRKAVSIHEMVHLI